MKRVVIIGGGFAGTKAAMSLEKNFDVTLIDTKDYFEFTPSILRVIVELKHIKKIQSLHKNYLKKSTFVKGRVKSVTDNEVMLDDDKVIGFDYLIIATGSRYRELFKESDLILPIRAAEMEGCFDTLKRSMDIVIIGGGLVGVELAAEIATKYPHKNTIIIHSRDKLIDRNPLKASVYAQKFLSDRGVKFLFGERGKEKDGSTIITDKGTKIKADMIFSSNGILPNAEFMANSFPETISDKGYIKLNNFLQVPSHPQIFVAGDVTDIKEEKTGHVAEMHASVIVKNINNIERKRSLEPYIHSSRPMVISLGKFDGIFVYKNFVITGLLAGFMKWLVEKKVMIHY